MPETATWEGLFKGIVAPEFSQYDSEPPWRLLPAVTAGSVKSTVKGAHTGAGLLVTKIGLGFTINVPEPEPEQFDPPIVVITTE